MSWEGRGDWYLRGALEQYEYKANVHVYRDRSNLQRPAQAGDQGLPDPLGPMRGTSTLDAASL